MADNYGLLAGLIQGIDKGVTSYQNESERMRKVKKEETDEARKLEEMKEEREYKNKGLINQEKQMDLKEREFAYNQQKGNRELEIKANGDGMGKAPTDAQSAAAGYARRLEQSEQIFKDLEGKGYNFGSRLEDARGLLPGEAQSNEYRSKEQAENNFINAVLRRESGASISPAERQSAAQQYFVRPGDPQDVAAQKKANRQQVIENLKGASGRAYGLIPLVPTGTAAAPKGLLGRDNVAPEKADLQVGAEQDGYIYKGGDPSKPGSWRKK